MYLKDWKTFHSRVPVGLVLSLAFDVSRPIPAFLLVPSVRWSCERAVPDAPSRIIYDTKPFLAPCASFPQSGAV